MTGCGSKNTSSTASVDYEIIEKEDISVEAAKRYSYDVVIKEKVNVKELEDISKEIVEKIKEEEKFNAVVIWFYDYKEYIGEGHTLGKTTYAPEGDWAKADTVSPGEYEKMDYNYELMEKDWSKQLTKEEAKVYKAWHNLYQSKAKDDDLPDEDKIDTEIAKKFDISSEEVNKIMKKQLIWQINDKNKTKS